MFLLKCDEDESYCMVNDEDVIFDDKSVKKGDTVLFYYNKKQYTRNVVLFSDDEVAIETELKKYRTEWKVQQSTNKSKRKKFDIKEHSLSDNKRQTKTTKETHRRTNSSLKTKKIEETMNNDATSSKNKNIKDLDESMISSRSSSTTYSSDEEVKGKESPSKEELIQLLQNAKTKIAKLESTSKADSLPHINSNIIPRKKIIRKDDETRVTNKDEIEQDDIKIENNPKNKNNDREVQHYYDDEQLFGPDCDNMVLLRNGIFCKRRMLEAALSTAKKASHLARQLIPAVFKPEAIMQSTLKGQSPRITKVQIPSVEVNCLHGVAKDAIIDFSIKYAEKKGWPQQTIKEIEQAMTQKVGEIKRQAAKNKI